MIILKMRGSRLLMAVFALGSIGAVLWRSPLYGAESPVVIAPPVLDNPKAPGAPQTAVIGRRLCGRRSIDRSV
jgi:hypothetical protein